MTRDAATLVELARTKALKACELLDSSVNKLPAYDPEEVTTPQQQEPSDPKLRS